MLSIVGLGQIEQIVGMDPCLGEKRSAIERCGARGVGKPIGPLMPISWTRKWMRSASIGLGGRWVLSGKILQR